MVEPSVVELSAVVLSAAVVVVVVVVVVLVRSGLSETDEELEDVLELFALLDRRGQPWSRHHLPSSSKVGASSAADEVNETGANDVAVALLVVTIFVSLTITVTTVIPEVTVAVYSYLLAKPCSKTVCPN